MEGKSIRIHAQFIFTVVVQGDAVKIYDRQQIQQGSRSEGPVQVQVRVNFASQEHACSHPDVKSGEKCGIDGSPVAAVRHVQFHGLERGDENAEAKASLQQTQAQLAQAELDLHDTTLIAPSDGTLMTRAVEPGSMLSAGSTVLTLSLTRPVWVRAYIDEPSLGQVQPGRELLLYTDGRPDKPYHGQIGFVSPTAEFTPKTVETPDLRTDLVYRLRIVVTDADDALRQGMPVTVQFGDEAGHE